MCNQYATWMYDEGMKPTILDDFPSGIERDEAIFRQAVKDLREKKGWSQNQLANELRNAGLEEYRQTTVARLEKGTRAIRLGESRVIAHTLGASVEEMLLPSDALDHVVSLKRVIENHWDSISNLVLALKEFLNSTQTAFLYRQTKEKYMEYHHEATANFSFEETMNNSFRWIEDSSNFDIGYMYKLALSSAVAEGSFKKEFLPELIKELETINLADVARSVEQGKFYLGNNNAQGD